MPERISKHPLYNTWIGMKQRCFNEKHKAYDRYGGRGISVCNEWRNNFKQFASDMGERPNGHTLDRIDVDGHYEPRNCRWADIITQANNTRIQKHNLYVQYKPGPGRRKISYNGQLVTLKDLSIMSGISVETIRKRIKDGLSSEQAVALPLTRKSKKYRRQSD